MLLPEMQMMRWINEVKISDLLSQVWHPSFKSWENF